MTLTAAINQARHQADEDQEDQEIFTVPAPNARHRYSVRPLLYPLKPDKTSVAIVRPNGDTYFRREI